MAEQGHMNEVVNKYRTLLRNQSNTLWPAIVEEATRYQERIDRCIEDNLPIFDSLTLGFSRRVDLEMNNFTEVAKHLQQCVREQFIEKMEAYDPDTVAAFNKRTLEIMEEETERQRARIHSTFLEYTEERADEIAEIMDEFSEMKKANDGKKKVQTAGTAADESE